MNGMRSDVTSPDERAGADPKTTLGPADDWAPMFVSVVIANLNGVKTLGDQLTALEKQTYGGDWEIVIADNGSTDGSIELIREWMNRLPNLRLVDASAKRGSSYACNTGAAAARGDLLAFCDNDDVVSAGWLAALVEASKHYDLVGGYLEERELNDELSVAWRIPPPRDRLAVANDFLPYVPSGNCAVRASVFQDLGGWNEDYLAGGEDEELSFRATLRGYRVGFAPDAVLHYRYRPGIKALARQHYRFAIQEGHLYRDFRQHGMPRSSIRAALVEWAWLVWHLPDLFRSPQARGAWVRKAALRLGRVRGSLRYRVLYL